jgi:pimeloyl-ACP methyl ester carboxylesterase
MRVVFLHGLESGASGNKAKRLRATHDLTAPELPTAEARAFLAGNADGQGWVLPEAVAAKPFEVARAAVAAARPDVLIGSSFGGGLAARLAAEGAYDGPLVLLAPAAAKLFAVTALPQRKGRVVVVHGRADEVVPSSDSVRLAEASVCELALWLVDDDHRLARSVEAGLMDEAIAFATAQPRSHG